MENKIVVIGAGYAGILTAKKLAKKFTNKSDVSITIIDKNPFHTMLTELHEVAANRVEEDSIKIGLHKVFAGRNVKVIHDIVNSIDFDNKSVIGKNEIYNYDFLVIAAGSRPTFYGVLGADEHSFKLWSYEDAIILREHIHNSFRIAAVETNVDVKKRILTFYVVGAGFTGVEMAGELAEYVPILCEKFEIDRQLVSISIVDILSRTIPILPEKLSAKVEKRLRKMGVNTLLNTSVVSIGNDFIDTKTDEKITHHSCGTVIWAAGIESAEITQTASKTLEATKGGRIKVDPYLRAQGSNNVFVVGDNMFYIPKGEKNPVPQMVENCENSAGVVARNIICAVTGSGEMLEYNPSFHGVMVSIGGRYGVARVGLPNRMFNLPSFLAMLTKHFINIVYFVQVLGWNKAFGYIKHEFFTIRNCRSFLGGHFSNRTPSFLLVPLRVWLGIAWLFEGVMKIYEGWLSDPKLTAFFGGANTWYNNIINGTTGGSDAVTEATAKAVTEVTSTGTVIFNINFLGLAKAIFVSGNELASSTISDYAFKLDIPIMNWFIDKFILANNSVQVGMQAFIVYAEILIGLALIGGLFTLPATAFSLVLQVMFVTTTGLYLGTFWMIFAAIALLINAGKTLGLDYYVMPYIKRKWKKLPFVRKFYIYND